MRRLIGERLSGFVALALVDGVADGTGVGGDGRVPDEAPHDANPRGVAGEVVIVLGGHLLERREARSGNAGEIVVLVVVADVVGQLVQNTIVRVSLVALGPFVVLGDEVAGEGMERGTHEGREEEVGERLAGHVLVNERVYGELEDPLQDFPLRQGHGLH